MSKTFDIKVFNLLAITFLFVMFPRVLTALGAPKTVDFFHFIFIVACFFVTLIGLKQIPKLFLPLGGLFVTYNLSGFWNEAGTINIILGFLLIAEPIIFAFAFSNVKSGGRDEQNLKRLVYFIVFSHLLFSFVQVFILGYIDDDVKGILIGMNNGHHVGGGISMLAIVYFITTSTIKNNFFRWFLCIALLMQILLSDSKQIVLIFIITSIGYGLLYHYKFRDLIIKLLLIVIGAIFLLFLISFVHGFQSWQNIDVLVEGIEQKLSVFEVEIYYFDSWINWFLGLGPGHSISRLGWLIPDYYHILEPFGVSQHEASRAIMFANQDNWISNSITGSSLFSLFFSYAGLWGDVGFVGFFFYFSCWYYIWKQLAITGPQKFLLLSLFVFGGTFAYLEEPSLTLFLVSIIMLLKFESTNNQKRLTNENPTNS